MRKIRAGLTFVVGLPALLAGGQMGWAGSNYVELLVPGPVTSSETYRVTANGQPLTAQRCDGRAGPASYVHFILRGPVKLEITCPSAGGDWQLSSTDRVDSRQEKDHLSFTLEKPGKLLLMTAAGERLFIFADAPEADPPDPADPGVVSVEEMGIRGDDSGLQTEAIQKAIDTLSAKPEGGVLYFPQGCYRTGTISVRSGVTLYLAPGSRIQGSDDPADYPVDPGTEEKPHRTQDIRSRLILFDHVEGAAILGRGEIDGMGQIIRPRYRRVPNLIRVRHSRNVRLEGVLLRRSAGWNTHIFHSDDVRVHDVKSFSNWSDGLDVDNSRNVTVEDVFISSQDDAFVIKSTGFAGRAQHVYDITLRDAVLWTEKSCVKIGTETLADVMERITFDNVTVADARGALVIYLRDGAVLRNLVYRDITVDRTRRAIEWEITRRHGAGRIEHVVLADIHLARPAPSILRGLDADHPIEGITVEGFKIAGKPVRDLESAGIETNEYVIDLRFVTRPE
jgi:hypothetical protein